MIQKTGDWDKALAFFATLEARYKLALKRALNRVGRHVQDQIKRGIRDQAPGGQAFVPLSEFTITRKRSSKALIDKADMINAITFKLVREDAVFVGLLRTAQGKAGQSLVNIGAVHEYGAIIPVTPKMRGFWGAVFGVHLRASTQALKIPARPFLAPVLQAEADTVIKIFEEEIGRVLKGG